MNVKKMAANDAANWARAEMFFGDGAGTRRKLLTAEIASKAERISGYNAAFEKAYGKQDFAEHALRAAKERKKIDRTNVVGKNIGALARGDRRGMSNGFAAIVLVGAVAHVTGYDKIAWNKAQIIYRNLSGKAAVFLIDVDANSRKPGAKS